MRTQINLDGIWDFFWSGDEMPTLPIKYNDVTAVPGCFDLCEPYCGKRGYAVYRRFVNIGGKVGLSIDGLGVEGTVLWDGEVIGECKYAYMPERFVFDAGKECRHELTVIINNRYNDVFHPYFDFYAYGGIYGSVTIEHLPENAISELLISTEDYKTGLVKVTAKADNAYTGAAKLTFDTGFGGDFCFENGELSCTLNVPDFKIWDVGSPNLHELTVAIDGDEVTQTFGIRHIATEGRKILLNGRPIKLLGYNRHESFPTLGAAIPASMMEADLKLIRDQGCNFIRGSHYPQRRRMLELCDRMGLLVWEETLSWGMNPPTLHTPEYLEGQLIQARTLTKASFNNPCVIIRGFLNENESRKEETRSVIKAIYDEVRAIDPHCLISYASNKYKNDICTDLVDVVSMNPYPGWYDSNFDTTSGIDNVKPTLQDLSDHLPKDRPFIISEIGAEAPYGFRDPLKLRWSEEYQAELLKEACEFALDSDDCAGIAMWHFADCRAYVNGPSVFGRARGFNNKGVLDEYRRTKLSWYALKEFFKEKIGK